MRSQVYKEAKSWLDNTRIEIQWIQISNNTIIFEALIKGEIQ